MKKALQPREREWLLLEKHHGKEGPDFFRDVERIEAGEPVDYVIGFTHFLGAKIDLSSKPLIPRAETEWWVNKMIHDSRFKIHETTQILDIFSGSGCIGIAILKNIPGTEVDFAEKDSAIISQIKKNLRLNRVEGKVFLSDVFENVPPKKYDYIFANPPYISRQNTNQVQDSVLMHEPHDALFAEDGGLFFIKKLLKEGLSFLKPGGAMFIEFDHSQKDTLEKIVPNAEFQKDQYGKWRVMIMQNEKS